MGKNPQDENTESVSQVDTDEQRQKADPVERRGRVERHPVDRAVADIAGHVEEASGRGVQARLEVVETLDEVTAHGQRDRRVVAECPRPFRLDRPGALGLVVGVAERLVVVVEVDGAGELAELQLRDIAFDGKAEAVRLVDPPVQRHRRLGVEEGPRLFDIAGLADLGEFEPQAGLDIYVLVQRPDMAPEEFRTAFLHARFRDGEVDRRERVAAVVVDPQPAQVICGRDVLRERADLVVTCRGLGSPVLTRNMAAQAGPTVVLDLALMRDTESSVASLPNRNEDICNSGKARPMLSVSTVGTPACRLQISGRMALAPPISAMAIASNCLPM